MHPRDLPEVVAELISELYEVRSKSKALNGQAGQLECAVVVVEGGLHLLREVNCQNTARLIEAFGRSMEPLINRTLDHEIRLNKFENPQ